MNDLAFTTDLATAPKADRLRAARAIVSGQPISAFAIGKREGRAGGEKVEQGHAATAELVR